MDIVCVLYTCNDSVPEPTSCDPSVATLYGSEFMKHGANDAFLRRHDDMILTS